MQPDRWSDFQGRRYFESLDGLRALSIIAVVWHHAAGTHRMGVWNKGSLGVNFFFAISGFLITSLLLRERARTGGIDLRGFYIRRTLRIFPMYYIVLALYILLTLTFERGADGAVFRANLPYFATYTSNWFTNWHQGSRVIFYFAWSLATEEQFYLCWPWIVKFARRWWVAALVMIAMLVAQSLASLGGTAAPQRLGLRILAQISPAICFGCLAALVAHRRMGFRLLDATLGRAWSVPLVSLLLVAALSVDAPGLAYEALMAALVTACCISPRHVLSPILNNPVARHIGTVSYGMYLMHMLAIGAARRMGRGLPDVAVFLLALPIAVLLATLSHRFIEQRFLALKDRLKARRPPTAEVSLEPAGPPAV
jgi:peptidoglycan/LPS O-acetylase OafA/YrhL